MPRVILTPADVLGTPIGDGIVRRAARGRGNQGDWATSNIPIGTLPEHEKHNAAIEAKRQAKLARKAARKAQE